MTAAAQLALLEYTAYPEEQPTWFSHLLICSTAPLDAERSCRADLHPKDFALSAERFLELRRDLERLGVELDDRVQFRPRAVERVDPRQIRRRHLARRDLARRHPPLQILDRRTRKTKLRRRHRVSSRQRRDRGQHRPPAAAPQDSGKTRAGWFVHRRAGWLTRFRHGATPSRSPMRA